MVSPGFEPGTYRVWGDRDNQLHHETVTYWFLTVKDFIHCTLQGFYVVISAINHYMFIWFYFLFFNNTTTFSYIDQVMAALKHFRKTRGTKPRKNPFIRSCCQIICVVWWIFRYCSGCTWIRVRITSNGCVRHVAAKLETEAAIACPVVESRLN